MTVSSMLGLTVIYCFVNTEVETRHPCPSSEQCQGWKEGGQIPGKISWALHKCWRLGKGVFRLCNQTTGLLLKKSKNGCHLKLYQKKKQQRPPLRLSNSSLFQVKNFLLISNNQFDTKLPSIHNLSFGKQTSGYNTIFCWYIYFRLNPRTQASMHQSVLRNDQEYLIPTMKLSILMTSYHLSPHQCQALISFPDLA